MTDYKTYRNDLYDWIDTNTALTPYPADDADEREEADKEKFILVKFGEFNDEGFYKDPNYIKKDEETLQSKILHRYSQKIDIEFIGEQTDSEALKLKMSMLSSSTAPANIEFGPNARILNLTTKQSSGYEYRYMLSLTTYFTLSQTIEFEPIESIEINTIKVNV